MPLNVDRISTGSLSVNGTEINKNGGLPYKIYTALLTQSGTDAPVATVLYNDTTLTFNWVRFGNGIYYAQPAGINYSNVAIFINPGYDGIAPLPLTSAKSGGGPIGSAIWLYTQTPATGISVDSKLNSASLEIRVYN
jgi:hypothetical protein